MKLVVDFYWLEERVSHGRVISRNPPVPADKQIAHHRGHSEESAYYPSF